MMRHVIAVLVFGAFAFLVFGAVAHAIPPQAKLSDLLGLEGDWRGELTYLDYGAGERAEIGMAASVSATPDDGFIVTRARYTDPGFDVFIMGLMTIDEQTGALVESYHRGNDIEKFVYSMKSVEWTPAGWIYVFEDEGRDDGRPALIRRTFSLENEVYTQRKDVDFLDDDRAEYIFRNETVLRRTDEPVTFDDFRKRNLQQQ